MANTITGEVVSAKTDKTLTVLVNTRVSHPLYKKHYTKSQKFYVHDEKNEAKEGDTIEAVAVRPVSKTKTWALNKIVTVGQVAVELKED